MDDRNSAQFTPTKEEVSRSFSTMMSTPYNHNNKSINPSQLHSVESPYTSLGSAPSSYASILHPSNYGQLRAKAERANALHESKSKAVMDALKGLQEKIQRLESDRAQAESNLKSLAGETKDYKIMLRKQQSVTSPNKEFQSKDLETKLENAQVRCEALEQQLRSMRTMMQQSHSPTSPKYRSVFSSPASPKSSSYPVPSLPINLSTTRGVTDTLSPPLTESPAIVKLQALEKEHIKLTASHCATENKLRELEDKMREESHQRKLLQDKAFQLQNAVATSSSSRQIRHGVAPGGTRTVKKRKKSSKCPAKKPNVYGSLPTTRPSTRSKSVPPDHCLLDLQNIPFVVGKSTEPSHSLGANIQNILSIMRSHNKHCIHREPPSGISSRASRATSAAPTRTDSESNISMEELDNLLATLQDEFAQLGFEHRELTARIRELDNPIMINEYRSELDRVVQKMETKGKQINVIRAYIKKTNAPRRQRRPVHSKNKSTKNSVVVKGGQEVEVITTIRAKEKTQPRTSIPYGNENMDKRNMLRNVQKLQTTLRKDDLVWR